MITYPIYLAGEFVKEGDNLEVRCPYSGDAFAQTFAAGKKEVNRAIERAVKAKKALAKLSSFEKWEILSKISQKIHCFRG